MFFGIMLTPKQLFYGVLGLAMIGLVIMFPWFFGTTPSRLDAFPDRIDAITAAYQAADDDILEKTKVGESAIMNAQVSSLKILRGGHLKAIVKATVKNVIDQPVNGTHIQMTIYSGAFDNCLVKLDQKKRFDPPLLPGEIVDLDLNWRKSTFNAFVNDQTNQSSPCSVAKINTLVGAHEVAKIDALVSTYRIKNPHRPKYELTHALGPTGKEKQNRLDLKEKLEACSTVMALIDEKKFKEEDINDHAYCFNKIGLGPQRETLRDRLSDK